MAKCCEATWNSTVNSADDGTLTIDFEDEVTGNITGNHHSQIRKGSCQNKKVEYETTKGGVEYKYVGKANHDCTEIKGSRSKLEPLPLDEDEVWVATKGGGGDDKDKKDKEKDQRSTNAGGADL